MNDTGGSGRAEGETAAGDWFAAFGVGRCATEPPTDCVPHPASRNAEVTTSSRRAMDPPFPNARLPHPCGRVNPAP